MWSLLWTKRHWGRFSPSTSVSPANHSTNFYIIIITRGWHNRPLVAAVPSGPNGLHPSLNQLKKNMNPFTCRSSVWSHVLCSPNRNVIHTFVTLVCATCFTDLTLLTTFTVNMLTSSLCNFLRCPITILHNWQLLKKGSAP
jgi:hypothetical protein